MYYFKKYINTQEGVKVLSNTFIISSLNTFKNLSNLLLIPWKHHNTNRNYSHALEIAYLQKLIKNMKPHQEKRWIQSATHSLTACNKAITYIVTSLSYKFYTSITKQNNSFSKDMSDFLFLSGSCYFLVFRHY